MFFTNSIRRTAVPNKEGDQADDALLGSDEKLWTNFQLEVTPLTQEKADSPSPSVLKQGCAALFYGLTSLGVIFVNKEVLTRMAFPSYFFIAISQFTGTCVVVSLLRILGLMKLAEFDAKVFRAVAPLMFLFVFNTVCGLGGTQHINLPMFTVLRRFSILFTLLMERLILHVKASSLTQVAVAFMIGGALVAAMYDLEFELRGYLLIFASDVFTAAYGVSIKHALNLDIPQMSLLYFNSLFGATVVTLVVLSVPGESERIVAFPGWRDPMFIFLYFCTSFLGALLQYSIYICTRVNSPLTTSVVGCFKNIVTTIAGMLGVGSDYAFGAKNSVGLAISMAGSFIYSWAKVVER